MRCSPALKPKVNVDRRRSRHREHAERPAQQPGDMIRIRTEDAPRCSTPTPRGGSSSPTPWPGSPSTARAASSNGHANRRLHGRARPRGHRRDRQRRRPRAGARPRRSEAGEPMWQLPLSQELPQSSIDSNVADMKNVGTARGPSRPACSSRSSSATRPGSTSTSPARRSSSSNDLGPAGATGVPVRTLVRFLAGPAGRPEGGPAPGRRALRFGPARPGGVRPPRRRGDLRTAACSRSGRPRDGTSTC